VLLKLYRIDERPSNAYTAWEEMGAPRPLPAAEIEVVAPAKSLCHAHKVGERFAYPRDLGKIRPWLGDSMRVTLRA